MSDTRDVVLDSISSDSQRKSFLPSVADPDADNEIVWQRRRDDREGYEVLKKERYCSERKRGCVSKQNENNAWSIICLLQLNTVKTVERAVNSRHREGKVLPKETKRQ